MSADNQVYNQPVPTFEQAQVQDGNIAGLLRDLQGRFPNYSTEQVVVIDASNQKLLLIEKGQVTHRWVISTAEAGLGSRKGSNQTPLGAHRLAQKIGDGAPLGTVFKARQNTGRIAKILTAPGARSGEDNVTTRIMWLDGLEPGLNKGDMVDSYQRFIYIHGTDEEGRLGAPASHGCIRMRNQDVIDLYDRVREDTLVFIAERR
ncbi:L,D-transpeptidase [uncultured Thiothrix sp.]|uniref:L,D-transpeptidase n=1 Tax=uncultured Thiothrix sp. TaxID=223185 RepID=UPI00260BE5EB|nr:L,D-transpeptidase [uncultured Thiothrix sp.]HMT92118.1 L,D-transpeptidase [Thiolinea sp.]